MVKEANRLQIWTHNFKIVLNFIPLQTIHFGLFTNLNNGCTKCCVNSIIRKCNFINPLTPNVNYSGHTAPQTCILYIYSTNTDTKYFKHGIYCVFFSSKCSLFHNSNIFGSCIIHILYTVCDKIKKIILAPKG